MDKSQEKAPPRPDIRSPGSIWLARFAKLTAFCTFLLVIAGSLVTTTGSGLAVPDWPLSFGRLFPPMTGGVLFEHGHRLIAGTVGILLTALAVWIWLVERRRWVRWLALAAWLAVVAQAILGGTTVLYKLPVWVSSCHAGLAMAVLALSAVLALVTDRTWAAKSRDTAALVSDRVISRSMLVVEVIYLQIIIGAVMRHMGAGLIIPTFPLARGRLIPEGLAVPGVAVHFAHRLGALAVGAAILYLWSAVRRDTSSGHTLRRWAGWLLTLYVVQFGLGAWTIWSVKALGITTAHVAVGALTLVVSVILTVRAMRLRWPHGLRQVSSVAAREALT